MLAVTFKKKIEKYFRHLDKNKNPQQEKMSQFVIDALEPCLTAPLTSSLEMESSDTCDSQKRAVSPNVLEQLLEAKVELEGLQNRIATLERELTYSVLLSYRENQMMIALKAENHKMKSALLSAAAAAEAEGARGVAICCRRGLSNTFVSSLVEQ